MRKYKNIIEMRNYPKFRALFIYRIHEISQYYHLINDKELILNFYNYDKMNRKASTISILELI
jgi:hypothetical protein